MFAKKKYLVKNKCLSIRNVCQNEMSCNEEMSVKKCMSIRNICKINVKYLTSKKCQSRRNVCQEEMPVKEKCL